MSVAKSAPVVIIAVGPVIALTSNEILWLVVMPMVAAWGGLVGLSILEGHSAKSIAANVAVSVCLAGVVGIVAAALIEYLEVRGFAAMLVSLTVGMAAISVAKKLRAMGGSVGDKILEIVGLRRIDAEEDMPDKFEELIRKLDEKDKSDE